MNAIEVGIRFVDDKGLVHTVKNFTNPNESGECIVNFDHGLSLGYSDVLQQFVSYVQTDLMAVVNMKPFVIEDGKVYLTNNGYSLKFKVIQNVHEDFVTYVSNEGDEYYSDGQFVADEPETFKDLHLAGFDNEHVRSVLNERKFKDTDFVDVSVGELQAIPAGSNPFHHDHMNMGTELTRGWVVMHEGYTNPESNYPAHYIILVNTKSGQRIKLNLTKRQ